MVAYEQIRIGVVTMQRGITAHRERHDVTTQTSRPRRVEVLRTRGQEDSRTSRVEETDCSRHGREDGYVRLQCHPSSLHPLGNRQGQGAMGRPSCLGQGARREDSRPHSDRVNPKTWMQTLTILLHAMDTYCIHCIVTTEVGPAYLKFDTRVPHGHRSVVIGRAGRGGSFVFQASL